MDVHERARKAKALLEDDTFQAVLDDLATGLISQWRGTASGSALLREQIAAELRAVDAVKARLKGWIDEAKFETAKIERLERRRA